MLRVMLLELIFLCIDWVRSHYILVSLELRFRKVSTI